MESILLATKHPGRDARGCRGGFLGCSDSSGARESGVVWGIKNLMGPMTFEHFWVNDLQNHTDSASGDRSAGL